MKHLDELNEELADLLGWKMYGFGWLLPDKETYVTNPCLDLDDLKQVWKVLYKRDQWMEFCEVWTKKACPGHENFGWSCGEWTFRFLNDPTGQVRAALEVLRNGEKND